MQSLEEHRRNAEVHLAIFGGIPPHPSHYHGVNMNHYRSDFYRTSQGRTRTSPYRVRTMTRDAETGRLIFGWRLVKARD